MIHKPTFRQILSFSVADMVRGETLTLCQSAVALDTPHRFDAKKTPKSGMLSAGLFGGSSSTPTPNVTKSDVEPKPEDFVVVPYRFISQAIVGGESWKATDFREDGVLKASLGLFDRTPIFSDHNTDSDNWAGIVTDPYWQEAFKAGNANIPAGISGNANIDSKTQYGLARGVLIGAIGSNSVTTQFDWEPSHAFDSISEFYDKIGTFDKDGQMITRRVKDIKAYFETSLLFAGADPFAKKLDASGRPIKVDSNSVYFSKANPVEKTTYETERKFVVVDDNKQELISLSKSTQKTQTPPQENKIPMNKFLLAFLKSFGPTLSLSFTYKEDEALTEAQEAEVIAAFAKLNTPKQEDPLAVKATSFAKGLKFVNDKGELSDFDVNTANGAYVVMLSATHEASKTATTALTTERDGFKKTAELGETFINAKRAEAVRLYKLSVGDKYEKAVEDTITGAGNEAVDGFLKQYGGEVGVKFAATCKKCQSKEIEMRSSFATELPNEVGGNADSNIEFGDYNDTPLFGSRTKRMLGSGKTAE